MWVINAHLPVYEFERVLDGGILQGGRCTLLLATKQTRQEDLCQDGSYCDYTYTSQNWHCLRKNSRNQR